MRDLREILALQSRRVNLATQTQLRAAIRTYAMLTTSVGVQGRRAMYFRRLQLLASGSPRAMNFAERWCCALHQLAELPPIGTHRRQQIRAAWRELFACVRRAVEQIQQAIKEEKEPSNGTR